MEVYFYNNDKTTKNTQREKLFRRLLKDTKGYSVSKKPTAKFVFLFDRDIVTAEEKGVIEILTNRHNQNYILDVSFNWFDDEEVSAIMIMYIVCAQHVTCATAELQELIYIHTGRLASIVNTPLELGDFSEPTVNSKEDDTLIDILWCGRFEDIFEKQLAERHLKEVFQDFDVEFKLHSIYNTDLNSRRSKKLLNSVVDFAYIPEPLDPSAEKYENRRELVEELTKRGIFVFTPNLEEEFYSNFGTELDLYSLISRYLEDGSTLNTYVDTLQHNLLTSKNYGKSLKKFQKMLEYAPKDDFFSEDILDEEVQMFFESLEELEELKQRNT